MAAFVRNGIIDIAQHGGVTSLIATALMTHVIITTPVPCHWKIWNGLQTGPLWDAMNYPVKLWGKSVISVTSI